MMWLQKINQKAVIALVIALCLQACSRGVDTFPEFKGAGIESSNSQSSSGEEEEEFPGSPYSPFSLVAHPENFSIESAWFSDSEIETWLDVEANPLSGFVNADRVFDSSVHIRHRIAQEVSDASLEPGALYLLSIFIKNNGSASSYIGLRQGTRSTGALSLIHI